MVNTAPLRSILVEWGSAEQKSYTEGKISFLSESGTYFRVRHAGADLPMIENEQLALRLRIESV